MLQDCSKIAEMSSLKAEFLAKASSMKQWSPSSPPSNRDRLELYALHKQAAAGDCDKPAPNKENKADKGKWSAWKSKAGLSQVCAFHSNFRLCRVFWYLLLYFLCAALFDSC